jgi:hypothetical protein
LAFTSTVGLGDGLGDDAVVAADDGEPLVPDESPHAEAAPATHRKTNAVRNRRVNLCSSGVGGIRVANSLGAPDR